MKVLIFGPSGAGKTTLVKLLVGLYEPTKGRVTVNGTDTRSIDLGALRRRIGYVSQETQLFAGTIRENLLFVNPEATDEECLTAIEQVAMSSILERTGEGLNTRIGESGIKISGGERQRVGIARAIVNQPDVIIAEVGMFKSLMALEIAKKHGIPFILETYAEIQYQSDENGRNVADDSAPFWKYLCWRSTSYNCCFFSSSSCLFSFHCPGNICRFCPGSSFFNANSRIY